MADQTLSILADPGMLSGFLEAAPDALVVVNATGRIVLVNQLTERLFGYTREELLGEPVELLVPCRYREAHARFRSTYSQTPRTRPMGAGSELSGQRKNGTEFPVEISLSPLKTARETLVISIIRDVTERRQAEARFRGLLKSAPDGIIVVDVSGRMLIVNTQVEKMFGYAREELIGQPIEVLVPDRLQAMHVSHREGYFKSPKTRPMGAGRALMGRKRDATEFPVEISLSPLETDQGILITSLIRDITERRRADEQLKASLSEKEVLLREIHHRVKNNLQITSSLLKLQSACLQDPQVKEMFSECQHRIRSMALVHEKLYQSSNLSRIDFFDYVESLAALLIRSFGIDSGLIGLRVEGDHILLNIETAVPCGLIVNELLSNCLKHAFPGGRQGEIVVRLGAGEHHHFTLSVRDDGVGLPESFTLDQTKTLGLQLVRTLAGQLRAQIELVREGGTELRISAMEAMP